MNAQSFIKHLMTDSKSLYKYFVEAQPVSLEDVKMSLMLAERESDVHVPDHHYRLGVEKTFENISHLGELFTVGLSEMADEYLSWENNTVYVNAERQNQWQLLLTYMPPLIMVSARIWKERPPCGMSTVEYISNYIIPNLRFTAIPSPHIRQLEELREREHGLCDLHMHLNGTLETDTTWQDFLLHPDRVYMELKVAADTGKVKEQYLQLSPYIKPLAFRRLLQVARVLRSVLCESLVSGEHGIGEELTLSVLLKQLSIADKKEPDSHHPMAYLVGKDCNPICMEAMLYVMVLEHLCRNNADDYTASLFHYYLLILGHTNKMLVQQPDSFGFEEFQKYTMNGFREHSEKEYRRRFLQIAGNKLGNIRLLEGRFSPKDSLLKSEGLIDRITIGWRELVRQRQNQGLGDGIKLELKLVAHLIKRPDTKPDEYVRHKWLRREIMHKATILAQLKKRNDNYSKMLVGIDAAASEFDAPPEVFAPAYRYLREHGYKHFTYHAGEDFFHVLSGLRAIYEAIIFLDLKRGDRIGHASATGIPIELWRDNIGEKMLIRQGEYLDDLLFAYHLIEHSNNQHLNNRLPYLELTINNFSYEVYGEHIPLRLLIESWLYRYKNPEADYNGTSVKSDRDIPLKYFLFYHWKETRDRYDKIIEIETFGAFAKDELVELQLMLLEYMFHHEIVIETLPTSNVVIGVHRDYTTYHLYNWLEWRKQGKLVPPIVVGTDDAGIFATNIYNEYCNIYCQFVYAKRMSTKEAIAYIEELHHNSRLYAFVTE